MQGNYPIDRSLLKARSKEWMRSAKPAFWKVALLYLLLTEILSQVVDWASGSQAQMDQIMDLAANGQAERAQYLLAQFFQSQTGLIVLFSSILLGLFSMVINYGYLAYSMGVVRGQAPGCGTLFSRFYMAGKIIVAELLMALFVFLWSLLFIIPGIVAMYRYQMIPYLLVDDPDCSILEAFRRSKQLMRGRKWELFVLYLSFLPWVIGASALVTVADLLAWPLYLVVMLACNAFLVPYQQYTVSQWYDAIRAQDASTHNPGLDLSQY